MAGLDHDAVRDLAAGYVLGALDPAQAAAVRDHLSACDQPHPELAELGGVVPYLADVLEPVEPPAGLRDRVLAAAAADLRASRRDEAAADRLVSALGAGPARRPAAPEPEAPAAAEAPPVSLEAARRARASAAVPASRAPLRVGRRWASAWLLRVAAVLVLAALGATSLLLGQQLAAERAYADELSRALSLAAAPGSRVTVLAPATPAASPAAGASAAGVPAGLGVVPPSGPGLLVMHDLAPTSGGQVYEAWAIVGSGAPAPLGSFSVGSDGRGWLEGISVAGPGPLTLALTREPGPGATKPTLPIVSSGTARPGA